MYDDILKKNGWQTKYGWNGWNYKTKEQSDHILNHTRQIYMDVQVINEHGDCQTNIDMKLIEIPNEIINEFYRLFGQTPTNPKRRTTTETIQNFVDSYKNSK